jgi:hypothetical protein
MSAGTVDRTNVEAIPEPRRADELELGCVVCRQPIGAKELVLFWPAHAAVAHIRCVCENVQLRASCSLCNLPPRRAS